MFIMYIIGFVLLYALICGACYWILKNIHGFDPFKSTHVFREEIVPGAVAGVALSLGRILYKYLFSSFSITSQLQKILDTFSQLFSLDPFILKLKLKNVGQAINVEILLSLFLISLLLYLFFRFFKNVPRPAAEGTAITIPALAGPAPGSFM